MNSLHLPPSIEHMDYIKDPRHHNIRHLLQDILIIALCAIISGTDNWMLVAEYDRSKEKWFKQFLLLPNGIPSHDTFDRLFAMLDPKEFKEFFARWVQDISGPLKNKTVAIDGKTLRRSYDKSAIHYGQC